MEPPPFRMTSWFPSLKASSLYLTTSSRGFMKHRVTGPCDMWFTKLDELSGTSRYILYSGFRPAPHRLRDSLRWCEGRIGAVDVSVRHGGASDRKPPNAPRRYCIFRVASEGSVHDNNNSGDEPARDNCQDVEPVRSCPPGCSSAGSAPCVLPTRDVPEARRAWSSSAITRRTWHRKRLAEAPPLSTLRSAAPGAKAMSSCSMMLRLMLACGPSAECPPVRASCDGNPLGVQGSRMYR
mmetsp:Transcript_73379/g.237336  ORF Transcript_73379/g.237336 Transcript_73379/m.237336 type:complete len:238 (+) Transcript_73379:1122-1835(+)